MGYLVRSIGFGSRFVLKGSVRNTIEQITTGSLDKFSGESGYAKTTVRTAMGSLEWLHFVHQRSMPISGKKVYFEVETDWWYVILEVLDRETMREFRIMNRALDSVVEMFESAESAKSERNFESPETPAGV
jgi:DNA-binding transcriptional regulator GbsR (MarR family)